MATLVAALYGLLSASGLIASLKPHLELFSENILSQEKTNCCNLNKTYKTD